MSEMRELTAQEKMILGEEVRQVWCEEEKQFLPSIMTRNGKTYRLNEETFVYEAMTELSLTDEERELMKEPISRWGKEWQTFMTENFPADIPKLQGRLLWELIPRKIDREAWEISEKTREEFQMMNPRPTTGNAAVWEEQLRSLTREQILENLVNVRRTAL